MNFFIFYFIKKPMANQQTAIDNSMLHETEIGHLAGVQSLLDDGANVNATNQDGYTALMISLSLDEYMLDMAQLLLDNGATDFSMWEGGNTALLIASENDDLDMVQSILNNGTNINAVSTYGRTALMYASLGGNLYMAKILLGKGADINATNQNGETAKSLSRSSLINEYFIQLFDENPNLIDSKTGITNLMTSASLGEMDQLRLYLPDPQLIQDQLKNPQKYRGDEFYHYYVVKDINQKDNDGNTALIHAIYNKKSEAVKLLLERGADSNIENDDGVTPLEFSYQRGNTDIVNLLQRAAAEKLGQQIIKHKEEIYPYLPGVMMPDRDMGRRTEIVVPLPSKYAEEYYRKCDETLYPNITRDKIYQLALELGLEDEDIQGLDKRAICQKMSGYLRLIQRQ